MILLDLTAGTLERSATDSCLDSCWQEMIMIVGQEVTATVSVSH